MRVLDQRNLDDPLEVLLNVMGVLVEVASVRVSRSGLILSLQLRH